MDEPPGICDEKEDEEEEENSDVGEEDDDEDSSNGIEGETNAEFDENGEFEEEEENGEYDEEEEEEENGEYEGDENLEIDERGNVDGSINGMVYDENETGGNGSFSEATMPRGVHECPGCAARYTDFMEYLVHSKSCPLNTVTEPVHQVRNAKHARRFPCHHCDKVFTTKSNAYRHMKQHLNNTAKPRVIHECHICFKKFTNRKVLAKHVKTHGGDIKSYHCQLCDAAFAHSSNLKKHMKNKHPDENVVVDIPPVTKAQVSNNFGAISMVDFETTNGYAEEHRQNGNGLSSVSPTSPPQGPNTEADFGQEDDDFDPIDRSRSSILGMDYPLPEETRTPGVVLKKKKICPICGKGFSTSGNLSRHKKIHNGTKAHQCHLCDRKFLEKNDLKRHLKTHETVGLNGEIIDSSEPPPHSDLLVKSDDLTNYTNFVDLNKSGEFIKSGGFLHLNNGVEQYDEETPVYVLPNTELNDHNDAINDTPVIVLPNTEFDDRNDRINDTPVIVLPNTEFDNHPDRISDYNNGRDSKSTELNESMEINEQLNQLTSISLTDNGSEYDAKHNEIAGLGVRMPRKVHKCRVCRKEFLYRSNYLTHMRIHSAEKPFKCNICSSRFTQSSNLYRHMKLHKSGKPIRLKSTNVIIDDEFLGPEVYENRENEDDFEEEEARVVLEQVNKGPSRFCNICGKQFSTEGNLARHMKIHEGEKPFTCKFCPQSFIQSMDLKRHLRIHIQENINPVSDPLSGDDNNTIVVGNVTSEYGIQDTGYGPFKVQGLESHKCPICDKELSTEGNLKRHMKIHSGSRPYQCQFCHRTFENEEELKRHSRIHAVTNQGSDTQLINLSNGGIETGLKNELVESLDDLEKGNDLQAFMRSQTPKLQFFASREQPTISSSPLGPILVPTNKEQIEIGKRALKRSQLDQLMSIGVEDEPKVMIIHNNEDFDSVSPSANTQSFIPHPITTTKSITTEDGKPVLHKTDSNPRDVKASVPSLDVIVNGNDDFNAKEEPEMWFMEKSKPPAQLLSGRELREKYFGKKSSANLLPAHVDEPVAMSSAPRPPDDSVVQPLFVYKNAEPENPQENSLDDIIVVNTSQVCNICAEHFSTEEELAKHMMLHENGMLDEANALNLHMCKICGKKFSTDGNLNRHMKIHTGEKPFQCGSCGRQFTQSNDLKRHLKIHMRPDGLEGSTCTPRESSQPPEPGNQSPSTVQSTIQLSVDGGENAIYACGTCGKRYSSFPNLKRHLKLHAGLQASQYEVIDMKESEAMYGGGGRFVEESFARQSPGIGIKPGMENSPSKNNEKYFLCKVCQKSYTSLGNLKRHIELNHSGAQPSDLDESVLQNNCDDMSSEGAENGQLVQSVTPFSIVKHNGRRYICRKCGKHYSTVKSLNRHLRLHTGMSMSEYDIVGRDSPIDQDEIGDNSENPHSGDDMHFTGRIYNCKVCGKSYSTLGNLKRHLKLNHSDVNMSDVLSASENGTMTPENFSEDGSDDSILYIDEENSNMNKSGSISYQSTANPSPQLSMTFPEMNTNKYGVVVNPSAMQPGSGGRIQNSRFSMKNYKSTAKTTWCKLCGKSYFNISNLKRHMKIVHTGVEITTDLIKNTDNNKVIPANNTRQDMYMESSVPVSNSSYNTAATFECHICHRSFSSEMKLKSHMQLHGDMNSGLENVEPVIADYSDTNQTVVVVQIDNRVDKLNDTSNGIHVESENKNFEEDHHWVNLNDTSKNDPKEIFNTTPKSIPTEHFDHTPKSNPRENFNDTPKNNLRENAKDFSDNAETVKDESSLNCHVCGKSYSCHGNLKIHMKLNHNLVDDSPQPNKTVKTKPVTMVPSPPSPSSPTEKKFVCNVCSKRFSSILKLKRHLRLHPGFKVCQYNSDGTEIDADSTPLTMTDTLSPFTKTPSVVADLNDITDGATLCHICGKQYSTVGNLKRHMKLNHPGNEEEETTHCFVCGRDYASVGNLKRHMKLNHSNINEESLVKFTCHVCGERCSTQETLKHHVETKHSDNTAGDHEDQDMDSTMDDTTEEKRLSRTPSLEDLEQIQTADIASLVTPNEQSMDSDGIDMPKVGSREPCACPVCGKPYSTPGNLRRHMKLHQGMNTSQYKVVERQSYASFVDYDEPGKSLVETLQSLDPNTNPISMEDYTTSMGKSFACTVCGKNYMCLGNLKRHLDSTSCGINNPQCDENNDINDMDVEMSKDTNSIDISSVNNKTNGETHNSEGSIFNHDDNDTENQLEWTNDESYDPDTMSQDENPLPSEINAIEKRDVSVNDSVIKTKWSDIDHLHNNMDVEDDGNNTDNEDIDESMISIDINNDYTTESNVVEYTRLNNGSGEIPPQQDVSAYIQVNKRSEDTSDTVQPQTPLQPPLEPLIQPLQPQVQSKPKDITNKEGAPETPKTIRTVSVSISNNVNNSGGGSVHTCPVCGQQYTTYEFLQCHMATHTTNRKPQPQQNKTFRAKVKTVAKVGTLVEDTPASRNMRPHICPICKKEFSTGSNMSRHMKIHSGVKPYQCKGCQRYFTQSNDLKRHIKTHCPESDPSLTQSQTQSETTTAS